MKKNILLPILAGMMFLIQTSCEDYNKDHLDEVVTRLYFRNSGEIPLTLYRAGLDDTYKLVVNKAGYDLSAQAEAKIVRIDEIDLEVYNQEEGTAYTLLPANCYELPADLNCSFGSNDLYKSFDITLKTENIYELMTSQPDKVYVLPMQLVSSKDAVNANKSLLFLIPEVEIPTVYFTKTGVINNSVSINDPNQTIQLTLPIELIIDNQWSFDCAVSVEEQLLANYNQENNTVYRLLPTGVYTINPTVSFKPGTSIANVEINIDRTKLGLGTYILPLQLTNVSNEYFQIDPTKNICLFAITYAPTRADLTQVPLAGKMSANSVHASGGDGGGLPALIDGVFGNVAGSYYHSDWASPSGKLDQATYGVYIDFAFDTPVNSVAFNYANRNAAGRPKVVRLYGKVGGTWELMGILTETDLPATANGTTWDFQSSVYSLPSAFSAFRFSILTANGDCRTNGSVAIAEFSLYAK